MYLLQHLLNLKIRLSYYTPIYVTGLPESSSVNEFLPRDPDPTLLQLLLLLGLPLEFVSTTNVPESPVLFVVGVRAPTQIAT
tara:strand:- start:1046 stop:1291 length:246 start_codon:yes stop_codon:yes gene_type:complete